MDKQPETKFYAVCQFCFSSNHSNPTIEFNFKDQAIYYVCPDCRKQSKMTIKSSLPLPLPRAGLAR